MKFRNLMVLFIIVFGITILYSAEAQKKVEWEFSSEKWEGERIASAVVIGSSYNEVWDKVLDILLFKKFTPWGSLMKVTHETVIVEKNSGLIVVKGLMGSSYKYTFKVMIREKDGQIVVKCRSNGKRKKEVIEKFFQLLEESL